MSEQTVVDEADHPPGPGRRLAVYLGIADDSQRLERFSTPWWVRTALAAATFAVVIVLVALGG